MNHVRPDVPQIDGTCTGENVHERAERVAVPDFDYMSSPMVAMVDGIFHIDPDAPPLPRRHHRPRPAQYHTDPVQPF
ncbi:hypothetical protein ACWT_6228 [Actinoplanes sp. SE50]|uniref:hypothetical protein n=1 Tax=unclassified Actinoplanes TaxID=2626549 RepID=UPI00023ECF53|nr:MULTISPECIES: hypothetical protein [unclassified Actinoplanes]AEV87242.1 hypothetical protein ACPL_6360 [Actinoplanes sp. SE50/110]ATO85643.1 hypothetical protein ACWT_6228 [Actinoplanes sp. SE50]SLM03056.1 hypothetical protein ACSP50_6342 [Actinoplanes sp. SE50/110]